jgi:uncharacterized protein YprB with RNaseH-like and TPR domain
MPGYPFEKEYDLDKVAFFDIETTGFAADSTYLYLIGCAYHQSDSFHLIQWFCDDIREEARVITSFFEFIKNYQVLIHYNGSGFDLPYLSRKCELLGIDNCLKELISIDIYKRISPYKKLLKLPNYKQKTLETFLDIHRVDSFRGGDLIQVYQSYLGKQHYERLRKSRNPGAVFETPSEAELLLHALLLHNEDDIRGLLYICPILNYADISKNRSVSSRPVWTKGSLPYILNCPRSFRYGLPLAMIWHISQPQNRKPPSPCMSTRVN